MSEDHSDYEEIYDPGADDERSEEQRQADKKAEDRRMLLIRLLSDSDIRQWLWEVLDAAHAFETRIAGNGVVVDPVGTWLLAGEQKVGWWIWTQLDDASPELASLMRREHK